MLRRTRTLKSSTSKARIRRFNFLFDRPFAGLIVLAIGLLSAGNARGQSRLWDAGVDDWENATNWDPAILPTGGVDVEINNGGTAGVSTTGQASRLWLGRPAGSTGNLSVFSGAQLTTGNAVVGDSGTGTATLFDGSWTSINMDVGNFGTGTLNVTLGSVVTSSGGYLGLQPNATAVSTGTVNVSGTDSKWLIPGLLGGLRVGFRGTGNLFLESGGTVEDEFASIGTNANATGVAWVDAGTWTNRHTLTIGELGRGTLHIVNGGSVSSASHSYLGRGTALGDAFVRDNSSWSVGGTLYVGYAGSGLTTGRLSIYDQAQVTSESGVTIGHLFGSRGQVFVDSKLTSKGPLIVGNFGEGFLLIELGGLAETTQNSPVFIAQATDSVGTVNVEDAGSSLKHTGVLEVGSGGTGTLSITGGGAVENVNNSDVYIGRFGGSDGTVNVNTGSTWSNDGQFYVGYSGIGRLNIGAGGTVQNGEAYIGRSSDADGAVEVDAGGSWTNTGILYVGYFGKGTLNIKPGGTVQNLAAYIGHSGAADGAVDVDAGGTWTVNGTLNVGHDADGTLNVDNGGIVQSTEGNIAYLSGTSSATINGKDPSGQSSRWTMTGELSVGTTGTGTLNVAGGGRVENAAGYLGRFEDSSGIAIIDGRDSLWKNTGDLIVGSAGTGRLDITAGARVDSAKGIMGLFGEGNGDGTVSVVGMDASNNPSQWICSGELTVGAQGRAILNITGGGLVQNTTGYISSGFLGDGTVNVQGTGSLWKNTAELHVGYDDYGTMNVMGGKVENTNTYLGRFFGTQGTANIGQGGIWKSTGDLYVGHTGTGRLFITGGSNVENNHGYVGWANVSLSNEVTVDGVTQAGVRSTWQNNGDLHVGHAREGVLNITSGGHVKSTAGYVGFQGSFANGTVTVKDFDSKWENTAGLTIARQGKGVLNIEDGGQVVNTTAIIGSLAGSEGTVNVKRLVGAPETRWVNSGSLTVGSLGKGTLNITGAAEVPGEGQRESVFNTTGTIGALVGSNGTVIVDNGEWVNSSSLTVGSLGVGKLEIRNGGKVVNQVEAIVGAFTSLAGDGDGTVTIDGSTSLWLVFAGPLTVGDHGNGKLSITNGADVYVDEVSIGRDIALLSDVSGELTVDGRVGAANPSYLRIAGDIAVGQKGTGKLNITNGGSVYNLAGGGGIGLEPDSSGSVKVDNAEWLLNEDLFVGIYGAASLEILNGGMVGSKNGYVRFYEDPNAPTPPVATVTVSGEGSVWENLETLTVGLGAVARAELRVLNGGKVTATDGAVVGFDGSLIGNGLLVGDLVNNGSAAPGTSPGTLTIDGNYTQSATGRLQIELASSSVYDVLAVTGQANLGGALEIFLLDGFTPAPTDTFEFLTAASFAGAFTNVIVSSTSGGSGAFDFVFTPTGLAISNFQSSTGPPGDYNENGTVDAADYTVWRDNLGSLTALPNDNTDGVGPDDYTRWVNSFGATPGAGSGASTFDSAANAAAAIPEPMSWQPLLMAAIFFGIRRLHRLE
jgi:T5SS/PEP-CTERM-associated repeat protein